MSPGYHACGNLRLATHPQRLDEFRRYLGVAKATGVEACLLTPEEIGELWPLMTIEGIFGGLYNPQDGHIAPADLTAFVLGEGDDASRSEVATKRTRVVGRHVARTIAARAGAGAPSTARATMNPLRRKLAMGGAGGGDAFKQVGAIRFAARTLDDVLRSCSVERGYTFDSTVVPLRLLLGQNIGLESRAQAKRVASRLPAFRRAEVDFSGIADIGHGFADELFRVFERQHPLLQLVPVGMAPRVSSMIESDHVVEVVGAGIDEESDVPWIAMELLQGDDLARQLTQLGALRIGRFHGPLPQLAQHTVHFSHCIGQRIECVVNKLRIVLVTLRIGDHQ